MANDPIDLFAAWYNESLKISNNPNAAALATATKEGKPSVRIVLLKAFDARGFVFYTNLESRKANEISDNPQVALCFFWPQMGKQVRIEGNVVLISNEEADKYFATRTRESQISAWASKQSQKLISTTDFEKSIQSYTQKFLGKQIPRPEFWSGYRVIPNSIEFWTLGADRLHQRALYFKNDANWECHSLYP